MTDEDDDTPCVGVCMIEDGYCVGCGRSEAEIRGEKPAPASPPSPPAPEPAAGA